MTSQHMLEPGRQLVGYDLRRAASLAKVHMTAYDEEARYESVYDLFAENLSGLNLFALDPASIVPDEIAAASRVIAFDLPKSYVEAAQAGNVSVPPALPAFDDPAQWEFLGFDVVDPRTQFSALDQFTRERPTATPDELALLLDAYGLLGNFEAAVRVALTFNRIYPEHAPFVPCGIWLKRGRSGA